MHTCTHAYVHMCAHAHMHIHMHAHIAYYVCMCVCACRSIPWRGLPSNKCAHLTITLSGSLLRFWPLLANSAVDVRIIFERLRRSPLAGLSHSLNIVAIPLAGKNRRSIPWRGLPSNKCAHLTITLSGSLLHFWPLLANSAVNVRISFERLCRSPLAVLSHSLDIVAIPATGVNRWSIPWRGHGI